MPLTIVLVIGILAACSGPGRRDATYPPSSSPTVAIDATATSVPPMLPTEPPTPAVATQTATPAPEATPTPRPTPTPTPVPAPSAVESVLLSMLPASDGLPPGWSRVSAGTIRDRSGATLLCGVDPFPNAGQRVAEVEAEYQRNDPTAPASILQSIVAFTESTAVEAMGWARQTITCHQWTAADGTTIVLDGFEDAGLGEESLTTALDVTAADGTRVTGRWFLVRKGGLIATIAYLGNDANNQDLVMGIVGAAVHMLDPGRAAAAVIDPAVQSTLLAMALHAEDLGQGWIKVASGPTPRNEETSLCGADLFPQSDGKIGDVTARFSEHTAGRTVVQRAVAYPAAKVQQAMDRAHAAASCETWVDPAGATYQIDPPQPIGHGIDGVVVAFVVNGSDGGYGALAVVRVGAVVTSITFHSAEPLVPEETLATVRRAAELIQSAR